MKKPQSQSLVRKLLREAEGAQTAGGFPNTIKYVNEWFGEHVIAFIGQELIPSEGFTNPDGLEDSDYEDAYEDWASVNNPAPTTPQQKAAFKQALLRYLQANL